MPRHKCQKIFRNYSEEDINNALTDIQHGRRSVREAAKVYGVPRSTLGDYISGRSSTGLSLGRPPALPAHIERQLVETTQEAAARGFGVNRRGLIEKTGASYWTTAFLLCLLELFFQLCYGFSSLFSFSWCITLRRIFQCSTLPPVTAYFSCLTFRFVTSFFTNVRLLQH
jgi:hypothetical protein